MQVTQNNRAFLLCTLAMLAPAAGCSNHPLAALGERLGFGTASSGGGGEASSGQPGSSSSGGGANGPQMGDVYRPDAVRACPAADGTRVRPAADFLFVVDNSGSMEEEQTNLGLSASSLCRPDRPCTNACGSLETVEALRAFMAGPACGIPVEEWPTRLDSDGSYYRAVLNDCSFMERLYVFDVDWQIGILTTEMRPTDGLSLAPGTAPTCLSPAGYPDGRTGAAPMLRCLQRDPVDGTRVLRSSTGTHQEHIDAFRRTVLNVGTCGSGLEVGLWQVENFFSTQPLEGALPECDGDPALAVRTQACTRLDAQGNCLTMEEPRLIITVLSDEEDCSYRAGLGDTGPNVSNLATNNRCYTQPETLRPVDEFITAFRALRSNPANVRMGALVAGVTDSSGAFTSSSCRCNPQHEGATPVTSCRAMQGNSILVSRCGQRVDQALCLDNPDPRTIPDGGNLTPEERETPCCIADQADRYVAVARGMDRWTLGSICEQSYHRVMSALADLAR